MPTPDELVSIEFARIEQENAIKGVLARQRRPEPPRTDAVVELEAAGVILPARDPAPPMTDAVDVSTTHRPPAGENETRGGVRTWCELCGEVFNFEEVKIENMRKGLHVKRVHGGSTAPTPDLDIEPSP